ncbi:HlyC/CorC family transporter [Wenzhouxiangella sp. XN24]|uniref:HlyC/CorC family transporter n=1 Tax=Wenzhouxiangella sp. XN24 TaxID=2713569 RepID=UPI0013E9E2C2|nr:HlyC/CorC family transporter [Wenzhouxiangella sp. XN24]NGX15477.1 HlyC/CorC family transporter [Wenzhouxiangella sp. XN24]
MSDVPLSTLFMLLGLLLVLSAFFSSTETALMSINRYRLRNRARQGQRSARLAEALLQRPDRLIGLILLGNNFVNIFASSLVTVIALRLGGEGAIAIGAGILTLVILIFSEVAPKTLAALYPERLALPAALVYYPLLKITYPIVWLVNLMANAVLRVLGVRADQVQGHALSHEELRTVVNEAGAMIPKKHQRMLIGVLELQDVTVDDIMVPRNEIDGIDLEDDWDDVVEQLTESQHTRLPVYRGDVDGIVGILHLRTVMNELAHAELTREHLVAKALEPYFVPEGTPLHTQLLNFQRAKRRLALVVDEYGDIQGLVTLDDILEEIVGEFTTDPADIYRDVQTEADGSFMVNGAANVRELNRMMGWRLPTDGPKTLNGLIVERLETIPEAGAVLQLAGYRLQIVQTADNAVRTVRLHPPGRPLPGES